MGASTDNRSARFAGGFPFVSTDPYGAAQCAARIDPTQQVYSVPMDFTSNDSRTGCRCRPRESCHFPPNCFARCLDSASNVNPDNALYI